MAFARGIYEADGSLRVTVVGGAAGGGTEFAEDAAHTTGDEGSLVLAVRRDSASAGSGTDGDYSTLNVNSSGYLYTVLGTGTSGPVKAEDAQHNSADHGVMVLGVRQDTQAAFAADGDYVPLSIDPVGNLRVNLVSASAVSAIRNEDSLAGTGEPGIPALVAQVASPSDLAGNGDYAWLQMNGGRLFTQTSDTYTASATFTPAAASHTANDVNGGAQTFSFGVNPTGSGFMITSASLRIDGGTAEATAWRLHLYDVTPPSATADDGAWDLPSGDRASYLGFIELGTAVDLGSTQWVETNGINKHVVLASGGSSLFGYLVNLTTLTPANVAHVVELVGTKI